MISIKRFQLLSRKLEITNDDCRFSPLTKTIAVIVSPFLEVSMNAKFKTQGISLICPGYSSRLKVSIVSFSSQRFELLNHDMSMCADFMLLLGFKLSSWQLYRILDVQLKTTYSSTKSWKSYGQAEACGECSTNTF